MVPYPGCRNLSSSEAARCHGLVSIAARYAPKRQTCIRLLGKAKRYSRRGVDGGCE